MLPDPEMIAIDQKDLRELDSAGIAVDDIQLLLHELAVDFRSRSGRELSKSAPSGLTKAEMDILDEGGASGVFDDGETGYARTRGLAVLSLEVELRKIEKESLVGPELAQLLGISPPRVRQLVAPKSPGLYVFRGSNGKQLFPNWQINGDTLIPHLKELVQVLSSDAHPVTVCRFMTSVNSDLESPTLLRSLTPREWLVTGHQPKSVLELARDL